MPAEKKDDLNQGYQLTSEETLSYYNIELLIVEQQASEASNLETKKSGIKVNTLESYESAKYERIYE